MRENDKKTAENVWRFIVSVSQRHSEKILQSWNLWLSSQKIKPGKNMRRLISFLFCCLICCLAFADNVVYYVARDYVKLLQSYDVEAATLGILPKGTPVKVISSTFAFKGLYEVKINHVSGYVQIKDLSDEFIEKEDDSPINISPRPYYQAIRSTRLLQSYDDNSATITKIEQGELLQIIGSTFAFKGLYEATYNGKKGYVLARDVEYQNRHVSIKASASAKSSSESHVVKQERKSSAKASRVQPQEKEKEDVKAICVRPQEEEDVVPYALYCGNDCEDEDFSGFSWNTIKRIAYIVIVGLALLIFWCIKKLREDEGYDDDEAGIQPPSHMVLSIVTFILFSRILGLIAFIFALVVNDRWNCGNIAGAYSASHTAKTLCYAAIIIISSLSLLVSCAIAFFI